jgi:hypothetical protein
MMDDPGELQRHNAYIDHVRSIGARIRPLGFVLCLAGVALLVWARFRGPGALSPFGLAGLAITAAGWGIFVYVLWARTRYVRRNPYKPES